MLNGVVGENTHRTLSIDEFRVFAMVDEWAPLIFINGADSQGARLFSLFHEIAHIWLGENDLYKSIIDDAIEAYRQMKENKESNGGNYYNTMGNRLDGCFVRALCESINSGRTTYSEAYRLTNTSRTSFSEIALRLGGVV